MSRSPILARLLWKDGWVIWPLALALCGIAVLLYLLVPLLPGNHSPIYSAWLLLFPNLFALGAPQLQVGQEEESRTFYWTRSLPIPWRTAFASNVLTAILGLATVWIVCGLATYLAYRSGDFSTQSSFAYQGMWSADLYRVITFSGLLLGLGYLCSWYFRSPIVALIAVVPIAFLSVGLTHLVNGWVADLLLGDSSADELRLEILLIGHTNIVLTIVYAAIAAYLARRRWTMPENEGGRTSPAFAPTAYRPAPQLALFKPSPTTALLWQAARQSSLAVLCVVGVLLLSLVAVVVIGHYSLSHDFSVMVSGVVLFAIAVLGTVTFGGDHARERHRFLAEIGLGRWQVWWTRLLIPLLVAVPAIAVFCAAVFLVENPRESNATIIVVMIGLAAFGISQLMGMWIRRPAVAVGLGLMLFVIAMLLGFFYEAYPSFLWTGWLGIAALFLASLSMCRRWMDRDRGAVYHGGMVGWLGTAVVAMLLPILAVRWWTTPAAMPEWRERTLAAAARVVDAQPTMGNVRYINVNYRSYYPGPTLRQDLERLQEAFAEAADGGQMFPIGYDLPQVMDGLLEAARSSAPRDTVRGPVPEVFAHMESTGGSEKWYADLLSFALTSVERLPELRHVLRDADLADQYEQIVVAELERPESRQILGEDRWREFVGRLRTIDERREDRRAALLASYWHYVAEDRNNPLQLSLGGYSRWSWRTQALGWERWRVRRWMELATRISLEQLESGVPRPRSPEERKRMEAWAEAFDDQETVRYLQPTRYWNTGLDRRVEALRELGRRAPAAGSDRSGRAGEPEASANGSGG
ncbi:hypothetical protein [Candidatus Laterigemmans baculatus]|uniref:hypothetical protein n=1 Tax=Candidatus Laterigemmans baculatus TaxID=2770505 RepID=UPI0013DB702A|nr:hypothetical protein [Candidatus Laterigemmans baculatus]